MEVEEEDVRRECVMNAYEERRGRTTSWDLCHPFTQWVEFKLVSQICLSTTLDEEKRWWSRENQFTRRLGSS